MIETFVYFLIGSITLISVFIVAMIVIIRHQNIQKRKSIIESFDTYIAVLQYHMERSYNIIHKDQILIYSLEATGLPDEQFNNALQSFCRLTIKLIGSMIYKELKYLYGNEETLLFNMTEYFTSKYDEDEIRSTAMENLGNSEEENK